MWNSMAMVLRRLSVLVALALLQTLSLANAAQSSEILLLVPDDVAVGDPGVAVWLDTAQEEGLQIKVITDSELLSQGTSILAYPGLILPDQVHQRMADNVVEAVKNYVVAGGKLMLVYDAGALDANGIYPLVPSRFSSLAGVEYLLYNELREQSVGLGPVAGQASWFRQLHVPPGKSMPFAWAANAQTLYLPSNAQDVGGLSGYDHHSCFQATIPRFLTAAREKTTHSHALLLPRIGSGSYFPAHASPASDSLQAVTGYVYGVLNYPSYVTRGAFAGEVILSSPDFGLVAGINDVGAGRVLFVNTPLSYLNGQTDGMLQHGFLSYFGTRMLKLPYLATVPEGRGGLVLNWHVDAMEAQEPIRQLDKNGVWSYGPFSIHVTAGPDTIVFGDGLGLNVPENLTIQNWIRYFLWKNHTVGSHGGWIHDYYGGNVSEGNQNDFQPLLEMNKQALEWVMWRPVIEYSSPSGNNPNWAMSWLEDNGFGSYYFTGHTGSGPTRAYRDGKMQTPKMWAFPVATLGANATFEEFDLAGQSDDETLAWYRDLIDFSIDHRGNRLIYMHPPGATDHLDVVKSFLGYADAKQRRGQFRWYTMTDMANFQNSRLNVSWRVLDYGAGFKRIEASHPSSLARQTWVLPKGQFGMPWVLEGSASVKSSGQDWLVVANRGTRLAFITVGFP